MRQLNVFFFAILSALWIHTFSHLIQLTTTQPDTVAGRYISLPLQRRNTKKSLVIHIGPPKTGTSTLRTAFSELCRNGIFAKDGYQYEQGLIRDTVMNFTCHKELRVTIKNARRRDTDASLARKLQNIPCWKTALERLEAHRMENNTNLFASNETWSFTLNNAGADERGHMDMIDWDAVRLTLMPKWDVLVILGYRRYPEWIFSAFSQQNKYKKIKPKLNLWPGNGGGRKVEPMDLPMHRHDMANITYRYTSDLKREMDRHPYIPYSVINMHQKKGSLVQTFLCSVLPNTPHSCQFSIQKEAEASAESIVNPRITLFYDALAVAAHERGFVDATIHKRVVVADAIQHHHEQTLNMSSFDFPLICPTQSQYEGFLNLSLDLEQEIVPDFYNMKGVEEEHRQSYWDGVRAGKYCWIDTDAVLVNSTWIDFFSNFK